MTYRDNEDALEARVEALKSQKAEAAREHSELADELAEAELELRAVRKEAADQVAPRWMLAAGAAGAGVGAIRAVVWMFSGALPTEVNLIVGLACTISVGLGLLGLGRFADRKLLRAAGWLCFFEAFTMVVSYLLNISGMWSSAVTPGWVVYIGADLVLGLGLLRGGFAPNGLRVTSGVLRLVQGGLSLVSLVTLGFGAFPAINLLYAYRAPTLLFLASAVTLALLFAFVFRELTDRAKV